MQISGYGSGFSRPDRRRRDRARLFRRDRRIGERLRGTLLRRVNETLSWVAIDGHELLAYVTTPHEPGEPLYFEVVRLDPEIVLREMVPDTVEGTPADIIPMAWLTARESFEAHTAPLRRSLTDDPDPESRRRRFFQGVAEDSGTLLRYAELLDLLAAVNSMLDALPDETAVLRYVPWLLPESGGQDLLIRVRDDRNADAALGFRLDRIGAGQVRILCRDGRTGYRLFLERVQFADDMDALFTEPILHAILPGSGPAPLAYLGAGRLAPAPLGILSSVFRNVTPEGLSRRINTRI